MLPDLESLACVDALARTLKFHVAAKSRFLSPAAFSKRVQQVEDHVGAPLFARTTRKVELTAAGSALLPRIRTLLDSASSLSLADAATTPRVDVVIGTRHELGMSWLMPARASLARSHPHITMHVRFGGTEDLEDSVLRLRTDAIVTSHAPSTTRLDSVPLHREDYVFVGAPRLLRRAPFRNAKDAAAHALLDATDDLPLFHYLRTAGTPLRFSRVIRLGTLAAIREAAVAGEGVCVLPRYFVRADLEAHRLTALLPRAHLGHDYFRFVFRADDPRRSLLADLADALRRRPLM